MAEAAQGTPAQATTDATIAKNAKPETWRERLHHASWWIAAVTAAVALVDAVAGLHISPSALGTAAGVVASMILGTGVGLKS